MGSLSDVDLILVETHEDVEEFFRWLGERRPVLAFDTETAGLEWWHMPLRTVQFGDTKTGWTIPWEWWAGAAREVFRRYERPMTAHNATFDIRFLEKAGLVLPPFIHDTMTMAHVIDPNRALGLKEMSKRLIDPNADAGQKMLRDGMRKSNWSWGTVPVDFAPYWMYSALDPVETARLFEILGPQVEPWRDRYETEIVVDRMMSDATVIGMRVDVDYARAERERMTTHVAEMKREFEREYGFSPTAVATLGAFLAEQGLPLHDRTATGQVKLTKDILESLSGKHPAADTVLEYRHVAKFVRAYFDNVLSRLDGDLVHCSVRTLGARTGRMSVAEPALQQIPSKDTSVRRMFLPDDENNVLVSIDFSNIEVRVLAHLCQDETMVDAFLHDRDVHMEMARAMYGEDAGPSERKKSKSGTLGEIYGIGISKFAQQQGTSEEEARAFKQFYADTFPRVREFIEHVEYTARERLSSEGEAWVSTMGGRRHRLTAQEAEWGKFYTLVNYLCQGTAAELLKDKLLALKNAGLAQYVRLPVHDEVLFSVPRDQVVDFGSQALEIMEDRSLTRWSVPITCDLEVYDESWAQSVSGKKTLADFTTT